MQLQPDRVSGTSVYTETEDSIQGLAGLPCDPSEGGLSNSSFPMGLSPKESRPKLRTVHLSSARML